MMRVLGWVLPWLRPAYKIVPEKCYGCGRLYDVTNVMACRRHHTHTVAQVKIPQEAMLGILNELQMQRDQYARAYHEAKRTGRFRL